MKLLTLTVSFCAFAHLHAQTIPETLDTLVESNVIVGAQVAISKGDDIILSHAAGTKAINSKDKVTTNTLFLIASSSKPFASATILRMLQDKSIEFSLDDKIDQWLPAYAGATIDGGGKAERAPTITELLCHRAGIYSQKVKITREQSQILYTFEHTLEDGVNDIASHPLLASPGARYAYSGAGYCVLGRVAELIGGNDFESLLQQNVCQPLGLKRTTYFPAGKFEDTGFATGFTPARAPHKLGDRHLWPLIGGSLYTTAEEMVRFAQAMAGHTETADNQPLLTEDSWDHLDKIHNPGKGYTLGWTSLRQNGRAVRLSHNGSLQGYRSFIAFDRRSGVCVAATWTLPNPATQNEAAQKVRQALIPILDKQ